MQPSLANNEADSLKAILIGLLVAFTGTYVFILFPRAYFRHDDWLILGNGLFHLANDWKFAFSPTLFGAHGEEIWFLRPLFKVSALVFYKLFGLNYQAWLFATLVALLGAIAFAYKTILILTHSPFRALSFVTLFVCSVHLHFGSSIWIGEGLMNSPQLFLLFLSSYLFTKALGNSATPLASRTYWFSIGTYVLSLGFKEAGVIHTSLLFAIAVNRIEAKIISIKTSFFALLPFAILTAAYLIVRLCYVPLNQSYIPHFTGPHVATSLVTLGSALAIPIVALFVVSILHRSLVVRGSFPIKWSSPLLLIPLIVSVIPYIGHPFFSPGWLIGPGLYLAFAISFLAPELKTSRVFFGQLATLLIFLSVPPLWIKLQSIGWWHWHEPQEKINTIFKEHSQEAIDQITIIHCLNPKYPEVSFARVIGFPAGLKSLWTLHSGRQATFQAVACGDEAKIQKLPSKLILKFDFPNLTVIR